MAYRSKCQIHKCNNNYNTDHRRNDNVSSLRHSVIIQQITESSQKAQSHGKDSDTSTKLIVQSDNDQLLRNTELKHKMSQSASESGGLKTWDQLTIISFQKADATKE